MSNHERFNINPDVDLLRSRFDKKPKKERVIQGASGVLSFGVIEDIPNAFSKLQSLRDSLTHDVSERTDNFKVATEAGVQGRKIPAHLPALLQKYPEEYESFLKAYFTCK